MASSLALETTVAGSRETNSKKAEASPRLFALARVLLLATLLAAPLPFGAVQPWAWGSLALMAFLLLLLWSIASVQQGVVRIVWSPLYVPAGLFLLLGLIQFAGHLTMDFVATRESLLKLATDLIFFFVASQLVALAPKKTLRLFGSCVVVYAFLMALFAIFQFFSSHGLIYWNVKTAGWTFGPYVNHNHYAGLMEMLIPISVASVLPRLRRHPSAFILGFIVLIPIVSLLLSGSRGGLISLFVEVLLAALVVALSGSRLGGSRSSPTTHCSSLSYGTQHTAYENYPRLARKTTFVVGAAVIGTGLLFAWMAPRQILERLETLAQVSHSPDVALGDRLAASKDSLRMFRDHPWLGTGLGGFVTVFPQYQSVPSDLVWDHAHNDHAEALAETGLPGGLLMVAAIALFLNLAFRSFLASRHSSLVTRHSQPPGPEHLAPSTQHLVRLGAALGCCGLLVHSFVDFNLHIPANAAWFAVCAAIATTECSKATRRDEEFGDSSPSRNE